MALFGRDFVLLILAGISVAVAGSLYGYSATVALEVINPQTGTCACVCVRSC
jgi:hypothetical protein